MQLNPIFALEVRARWRSGRSFLLLLGVTLALALVAGLIYQRTLLDTGDPTYNAALGAGAMIVPGPGAPPAPASDALELYARAGAIGRALFMALAQVNILAWLLVAAASAATGIARERERGLLESLQLSRMSARGQIGARFGANLLLLGALQLALLPIYSVAVVMGGVSLGEVGAATYLAACSAVLGTALGLWFSARSHRPTGALFAALITLSVISYGAFYWVQDALHWNRMFGGTVKWGALWPTLLHPSALFWALNDPAPTWSFTLPELVARSSAIWAALTWLALWSATRNVGRILPVASWQGGSAWVEKLRQKQNAALQQSRASAVRQSGAQQKASGALLTDLPLDRFVGFADPLLAREVKARFRLRRAGFWIGLVRFALFLGAVALWLSQVFSLFDPQSRGDVAPYGLLILFYAGTLCLAVLSATSWTREREGGTWEALKLSLLTPRQILRAKWLSPLISFFYYAAPLWILLPIGAFFTDAAPFGVGVLIVAAWWGATVALGLWMSWRVRNGTAAIAWTVGVMALLLVGVPALSELAGVGELLAQQKFGVSGNQDYNQFSPYYNMGRSVNMVSESVAQRYKAETGRSIPKPMPVFRPAVGQSYPPTPPDWAAFERWGEGKRQSAEDFKQRLHLWNPTLSLGELLFRENVTYSRSNEREQEQTNLRDAVVWSLSAPLLLTLSLLWLLRLDVRREQLNA